MKPSFESTGKRPRPCWGDPRPKAVVPLLVAPRHPRRPGRAACHPGRWFACAMPAFLLASSLTLLCSAFSLPPNASTQQRDQSLERRRRTPSLLSSSSEAGSHPVAGDTTSFARRRKQPSQTNRKTQQLRWIAQGIAKMEQRGETVVPPGLVECLASLASATTQEEVVRIGGRVSQCLQGQKVPTEIQERVIKATATTGLLSLACQLTREMLALGVLPAEMTQDALCSGLRRAGRSHQMETLIQEMGVVVAARSQSTSSLSLTSFNMMLASLCDTKDRSKFSASLTADEGVRQAWTWISDHRAEKDLGVHPDAISFATMSQAASKVGNRTLADAVWKTMQERGIQANTFAYNARLKLAGKGGLPKDDESLQIWDTMQQDNSVQPDRFTIDLALPALVRAGRFSQIKKVIGDFIGKNSLSLVSNAFSAFLLSLSNSGEAQAARELFGSYVKPSFAAALSGDASSMRLVSPSTKHFNILLDGYRKEIQAKKNPTMDDDTLPLRASAWELYNDLLACPSVEPDDFTYSTMMGLSTTPHGICQLIEEARKSNLRLSPVLLRGAITVFGDVGDVSSACWLFARDILPSSWAGVREWNVLLGAISKVTGLDDAPSLNLSKSATALYFGTDTFDPSFHPFLKMVDGLSSREATTAILDLMVRGSNSMRTVKPDSQSYCLAASALQDDEVNDIQAMTMFRQARDMGIPADGRFVNAIFRCFGGDIRAAMDAWKEEIRPACILYENRKRKSSVSDRRVKGKNLLAAYDGLLYCCGRALRPDIGLRLVYAMVKEDLEPNENTLNSYRSGKRLRQSLVQENRAASFARKLTLLDPYESLLFVECTKYDRNDRRREGERRVRIIV